MEHIESVIVGLITTFLGFVGGIMKRRRESEKLYLDNLNDAIDIYRKTLEDMKLHCDMEIKQLRDEIATYKREIDELHQQIANLRNG